MGAARYRDLNSDQGRVDDSNSIPSNEAVLRSSRLKKPEADLRDCVECFGKLEAIISQRFSAQSRAETNSGYFRLHSYLFVSLSGMW